MKMYDLKLLLDKPVLNRGLLIGNGFSIAASPRFKYSSIFNCADFSKISWVKNIFTSLSTENFELILNMLKSAQLVNKAAGNIEESENDAKAHSALVDIFIDTLGEIHPDNKIIYRSFECITVEQFEANGKFLEKFNVIFSLNYDILLYWSILENKLEYKFKDNFSIKDRNRSGLSFNESFLNCTSLWYLHGALHLRTDSKGMAYKIVANQDSSILNQLKESMSLFEYPTIVFEGSDEEKQLSINSNRYLSIANKVFSNSYGALFTYGFSFNENDDHIIEAIKKSAISVLCVGLHGTIKKNQKIFEKCEGLKSTANHNFNTGSRASRLEVYYYNTNECGNIWQ